MISIEQINGEIAALEEQTPTHEIMKKLANLYTVRDHMGVGANVGAVSMVTETIPSLGSGTDFAEAVSGMPVDKVLPVMDELVTTIQAINPRLYEGVMRKLQ